MHLLKAYSILLTARALLPTSLQLALKLSTPRNPCCGVLEFDPTRESQEHLGASTYSSDGNDLLLASSNLIISLDQEGPTSLSLVR